MAATYSKSAHERMYVVSAMPRAPNAVLMSTQTGRARTIHGEPTMPSAHIVSRNIVEYRNPRMTAQPISPSATSAGTIGVASTVS